MVLTEVFKKCYLKAFISLKQGTLQDCQSTAGLCKDMALEWRSESACTAPAAPGLQLGPLSRAALHTPQPDFIFPCPRITNTRYNWGRALNTKAFPRCGTLLAQWGCVRSRVSSMTDLVRKCWGWILPQFPLSTCNTISFKTDFMLCKCLEMELYCQTRVWMDTL